jgi:hypothetical protein
LPRSRDDREPGAAQLAVANQKEKAPAARAEASFQRGTSASLPAPARNATAAAPKPQRLPVALLRLVLGLLFWDVMADVAVAIALVSLSSFFTFH